MNLKSGIALQMILHSGAQLNFQFSLLQLRVWNGLSPVQIHEPLILIQSNPADDPEAESSPVQSGHNRVGICQLPCKISI